MRLDQVAVAIRARQPWESVDLGFTMVRRWWWTLYGPWLMVVVPIMTLTVVLCAQAKQLWLASLLIWWLKPLFDRIPLYVLSHAVFGAPPGIAQTVRAVPSLWRMAPLWGLLLRRFSPTRSFDLPVVQLEGLRGRERRERLRVLRKGASGTAAWHLIACANFELLANLTVFGLLFLLLPRQMHFDVVMGLFQQVWADWLEWTALVISMAAMLLIEPLYVAGGFGLYLNRRILLEGWDVELVFRRMAERLAPAARAAAMVALAVGVNLTAPPDISWAAQPNAARAPSPESAKQRIQQVLKDPAFSTKESVDEWRYVGKSEQRRASNDASWLRAMEAFGRGLALLTKGALWVLLAVAIVWLILNRARWLRWFRNTGTATAYVAPQKLFGLDLRPESLPADIAGEAQRLWNAGNARAALSLLYRGALIRLIERDGVELRESDTEGDCMRQVVSRAQHAKADFFRQLTAAWEGVAYAGRAPSELAGMALCRDWPSHFEAARP